MNNPRGKNSRVLPSLSRSLARRARFTFIAGFQVNGRTKYKWKEIKRVFSSCAKTTHGSRLIPPWTRDDGRKKSYGYVRRAKSEN